MEVDADAQFEAASKATKSFVVFRRFDTVALICQKK